MIKKDDKLDLTPLIETLNFSSVRAIKTIDKIRNKEPITLAEHLELDALIILNHRFKRFLENNKKDNKNEY